MYGIIYKATNNINGKAYIGKTKDTIELRKQRHYTAAQRNKFVSLFYRSIRKYGWNNFTWEIVEIVPLSQLNNKEKEYIKLYGNLNIAKGGDGGDTISQHPHKNKIFKLRKEKYITPKGKNNACYKQLNQKTNNSILDKWNNLEIKCLKHLANLTNLSTYLCKRTLLENGYTVPNKFITQQKLIKSGINKPSRKLNFNKKTIQKIIQLYNSYVSTAKIAKIVGIKSGDAIVKILKYNNIKIRTRNEWTTYNNKKRSNKK